MHAHAQLNCVDNYWTKRFPRTILQHAKTGKKKDYNSKITDQNFHNLHYVLIKRGKPHYYEAFFYGHVPFCK